MNHTAENRFTYKVKTARGLKSRNVCKGYNDNAIVKYNPKHNGKPWRRNITNNVKTRNIYASKEKQNKKDCQTTND